MGVIETLDTLTDEDFSILLEVLVDSNTDPGSPDISEIFDQYAAGTLDHYLVMMLLNDPGVAEGLGQIPGFDFDTFKTNMDTLDYDAFYLETIDVEALATAIYEGQTSFEAYVAGLATTAPETAKVLGPWAGFVGEINMYMVYVDEINYAFDNLVVFEKYFTMDYYLDNNMMNMTMEKTEDFEILTTMTLKQTAYAGLFIDVLEDVYNYLDGFATFEMPYVQHINCPIGQTCEPFVEYLDILNVLTQMGQMEMTMLVDPSDPHYMTMEMDLTDFVNALMLINAGFTEGPITNLSVDITTRDTSAITIPTEVVNLNEVAEEFAHFAIFLHTHDYVRDLMWYYEDYPDQLAANFGQMISLREYQDEFMWWFRFSEVFDPELSYMKVTGSILNPDVEIQLYWRDGTEVFDNPILLSELSAILDNGAPTRANYLAMIDLIAEENFHVTKMFLMFMLN